MIEQKVLDILAFFDLPSEPLSAKQFTAEEDGAPYNVWKIETMDGPVVLKKTTPEEQQTYEAFFPEGGDGVPRVFGFRTCEDDLYMLMEYVAGESMSHPTDSMLRQTLDSLILMQDRFWENENLSDAGYCFSKSYPNREKRLPYLEDLKDAYLAYLEAFRTVPRTLCNDDLLPFNVVADSGRAVIIDWEYGGILPYPCALIRLIAFGEDDPGSLFRMTQKQKNFALDYYYENLIFHKGISRKEYDRTMKLFLLKEYSEWVYCANCSGDKTIPYYQKYYKMAKELVSELETDGIVFTPTPSTT